MRRVMRRKRGLGARAHVRIFGCSVRLCVQRDRAGRVHVRACAKACRRSHACASMRQYVRVRMRACACERGRGRARGCEYA
eukprot:6190443-Pleurochrysis_carterae.AAC.3